MNVVGQRPVIGVIGGTGALGRALALRWARAGYSVIVGSRTAEKSRAMVSEACAQEPLLLSGESNVDAAANATLVVVTVPWGAQTATLEEIREVSQGKVVVDTTVPLVPPRVMRVQLPPEDSAAVRAQRLLGDGVRVVSAFHNVAAHKLASDATIECDVLVFGDDKEAREQVIALAGAAGMHGLHGGALANSTAAESLTSVLIFLNRTYQVDGAGIKITGQLKPAAA